jgi:hypothetical protein
MDRDFVAGTVKVEWCVSERDLKIADIERELTPQELRDLYRRIADVVTSAFHQRVDVYVDGEAARPVTVVLDVSEADIEIDDGPVNGLLPDLEAELDAP